MNIFQYNNAVETYADALFRFVFSSLKSSDDAKDIVQDTFEKVWKKKENIDGSKIKSYLFQTAYNTMLDFIKKNKKVQSLETIVNQIHTESSYSDASELVHKALDTLPEIQKNVVLLRDYEGYSYKEIGEIVGLNESQVKVYIFRARKKLQQQLGKLEEII